MDVSAKMSENGGSPGEATTYLCIYEVKGDQLKFAFGGSDKYPTTKDYWILKRVKK